MPGAGGWRRPASWLAPLALAGAVLAVLAVLADRSRHEVGDRAVLLAVVAGASALYLLDRRLVAAALAFGVATWGLGAEPPGAASDRLRALAALRTPGREGRPPADFVERARAMAAAARFEDEYRLYAFVALNLAAFLALLAASSFLRRGRRPG